MIQRMHEQETLLGRRAEGIAFCVLELKSRHVICSAISEGWELRNVLCESCLRISAALTRNDARKIRGEEGEVHESRTCQMAAIFTCLLLG